MKDYQLKYKLGDIVLLRNKKVRTISEINVRDWDVDVEYKYSILILFTGRFYQSEIYKKLN